MKPRSPLTAKVCALRRISSEYLILNPTEKILLLTNLHRLEMEAFPKFMSPVRPGS